MICCSLISIICTSSRTNSPRREGVEVRPMSARTKYSAARLAHERGARETLDTPLSGGCNPSDCPLPAVTLSPRPSTLNPRFRCSAPHAANNEMQASRAASAPGPGGTRLQVRGRTPAGSPRGFIRDRVRCKSAGDVRKHDSVGHAESGGSHPPLRGAMPPAIACRGDSRAALRGNWSITAPPRRGSHRRAVVPRLRLHRHRGSPEHRA